jgi:aminodeoxyfutalosine synthase
LEKALKLYDMDLFDLGEKANEIRVKKYGKKTYFNINLLS